MTSSVNVFDNDVVEIIKIINPKKVLDIGPGEGKYEKMLRVIEANLGHKIELTCVEIDEERVINRFSLTKRYDRVINCDAYDLIRRYPDLKGEIAISGDLLEHLPKSQGMDLLEYLQYRYKHIILVIPCDWPAFNYADYVYEAHVSTWDVTDFDRIKNAYVVSRITDSGKKFILAVVNSILIPKSQHFVINESPIGLEYGYLNT